MEHYWVRIADESLVFSAAHFITYGKEVCESLHGHNYRVKARVRGPLDENQCVVDFAALREALRAVLSDLDHRTLLPAAHPLIHLAAGSQEVEARFGDRRWVFPRADCVLLPIANTTAELLARYLAARLLEVLRERLAIRPTSVEIELEECFGQSAVCELRDL